MKIKKRWKCKLCRNITLAVFVSILIIEGIILLPSYKNYTRDELDKREAIALAHVKTLLANYDGKLQTLQQALPQLANFSAIKGATIQTATAGTTPLSFGELPTVPMNKRADNAHWYTTLRTEHGTRYDVSWDSQELQAPYTVTARLDTADLNDLLLNFVGRMVGLIVLIAGCATIATMLVVRKSVLLPILDLHHHALDAANDPTHPQRYLVANSSRADELGELFSMFNNMLETLNDDLIKIQESNNNLESRVTERTQQLSELNEQLSKLSNFDPITELPNRTLFLAKLEQILTEEITTGFHSAVMIVEPWHLDEIHDAFGQCMAEKCLKKIGTHLANNTQHLETIGKINADQFAILLAPMHELENIVKVAEDILEMFARPLAVDNQLFVTTVNIGIALITDSQQQSPLKLMHDANLALQHSKSVHPNTFEFHESSMNNLIQSKHNILVDLHHALEKEQFTVYYQPQYSVATGELIGAEALLRWYPTKNKPISPAEFIPIAEESGLIIPIGAWVFEQVCQDVSSWINAGHEEFKIAVNLSSIQFKQKNIVNTIQGILENANVPSSNLELEITESIVMRDAEEAIVIMHHLKELGLKLAIDDFGTGYSSLSYLKRFPIQKIKIDQSFVRCISNESQQKDDSSNIADAIIYLGHQLDLKVIAEGVETEYQLEFLKSKGCDEVQGFYFGKPVPKDQFTKLFQDE